MRLNLGCSDQQIEGFRGVDRWTPPWATDENFQQADLRLSWPWVDSSIDHIRAWDILEHLPDPIHSMNEIYRVLKPNGLVEIVVPTTEGRGAWQDPTHVSFWNRNSFFYYESGNPHNTRFREAYGIKCEFAVLDAKEERIADGVTKLHIMLQANKGPRMSTISELVQAGLVQPKAATFSILHATAHRLPFTWIDTWREWSRKAVHPERHEYIISVHQSDMEKAKQGAESIPESETGIPIKVIGQPGRYCAVDNWNQAAIAATGDVLIMGADDFFPTDKWDDRLGGVIDDKDAAGKEFVLHVSTGSQRDKDLIVHPMMSRKLFESWGYFLYPQYTGVFCDDDLTAHAKYEGVVIDARYIKFDHRNPILQGVPLDQLDEGYRAQNKREAYQIGKMLFDARVQSGFRNDVAVVPRKTIAVCLPGEKFSSSWLACWTQLLLNFLPKYNIIPLFGFSSNVYVTRCALADAALTQCERAPDYVLWIDDDNLVTTDQVAMLIDDLESNDWLDMVVGWSWIMSDTFEVPPRISCGVWAEDESCRAIKAEVMTAKDGENLLEIEWTGFPLVLMRRECLEKAGPAPFSPFPTEHVKWGFSGEDTAFCRVARSKGSRMAVDRRVKVPHLKLRAAEPLDPTSEKHSVEKEHQAAEAEVVTVVK